jgi:uncharacterized protein YndB with AHSA1/START domain
MTSTTENMTTTQVYRVYVKATPEAIWDAITSPDWTERYGYGLRSEFNLQKGGVFRALANEGMRAVGAPEVAVDGEVLEAEPPKRLVQTWRMMLDPDVAKEGFTRLTYDIEPTKEGVTRLTVTHELKGAPKLAILVSGAMEDTGAGGGWSWVLSDLKSLLETGLALDGGNH